MAQVPVSSGPSEQIRVPEFGTSFKLMDTDGDKVNNDIFQKQLPESGNKLMQAYTDAYDRFSQMRVTDATNAIEQEVNDYLMGENGAMRQQGESVYNGVQGKDGQRKPFAEAHFEEVEKIIKKHRGDLDRQQGFRLDDKLASYKERIRGNLLNHQMQQIEKHETDTYRTRAQIAADGLMTNILDPNARQEYIDSMKESIGFLYRNAPAETRNYEIKKALSGSLAQGMKSQIDIENLGGARKLLNKYRSQMTGKDVMDIEHALRRATKTLSERAKAANAYNSFAQWNNSQNSIAKYFRDEGLEVTPEQVKWAMDLSGGDMTMLVDALVVGKDRFEKLPADDEDRIVTRTGQQGDTRKADNILRKIANRGNAGNTVDKESIIRSVAEWGAANGIAPEVQQKIADAEYRRRNKEKQFRDATRDISYKKGFDLISAGQTVSSLPIEVTNALDDRDLVALQEYERKVAMGPLARNFGDRGLAWSYLSNPEKLSKMTERDVLRLASRVSDNDLNAILDARAGVNGLKIKNPADSVFTKAVADAIRQNGLDLPASKEKKALYNEISSILASHFKSEFLSQFKGDIEGVDVQGRVASAAKEYVRQKLDTEFRGTVSWLRRGSRTGTQLLKGDGIVFSGDAEGILNAGLVASGIGEPQDYQRNALMVRCLVDPERLSQLTPQQISGMHGWIRTSDKEWYSGMQENYRRSRSGMPTESQIVGMYLNSMSKRNQLKASNK